MSIAIDFIYEYEFNFKKDDEERLKQLINKAAAMEMRQSGELSITFCDDARIHELNREFRGIDQPTDVLSFPMDDDILLGDIIISIPRAEAQAVDYGHSFNRELSFLALHGFLHLLGYDHETEEEEKVMIAKQEHILQKLGILR